MSLENDSIVLDLVSSFLCGDNNRKDENKPKEEALHTIIGDECEYSNPLAREENCWTHVVIFTKDRPWQLDQLLRSMHLSSQRTFEITIIAKIQEPFQEAYDLLQRNYDGTNIDWRIESEAQTFSMLWLSLVLEGNNGRIRSNKNESLSWMFLTDDCIFLQPLQNVCQLAARGILNNKIKSATHSIFLTRLHPGITWCQTQGLPSPIPPTLSFRMIDGVPYFQYPLLSGQVDWAYPFDLSGGVYSDAFIQQLCSIIINDNEEESMAHPNKLEVAGNRVTMQQVKQCDLSITVSVPSQPLLLILAINRVQSVFQAPLATSSEDDWSSRRLLDFCGKECLDLRRYQACQFSSSHIGRVYLMGADSSYKASCQDKTEIPNINASHLDCERSLSTSSCLNLSVLIPVHSGPPEFARIAALSVLQQAQDLDNLQIILIDDRCSDGSIDGIVQSVRDQISKHTQWQLAFNDYRRKAPKELARDVSLSSLPHISLEIYPSSSPGVAAALNTGLKYTAFDFVARMDADDICGPGRFRLQLMHMKQNPELAVLGTHSIGFSVQENASIQKTKDSSSRLVGRLRVDMEDTNGDWICRPMLPPTDPMLTSWTMLFSCTLSHPSVMFRKELIVKHGGYRLDVPHAEDYELWLRLTHHEVDKAPSLKCTSIPFVGLFHRKHTRSDNAMKEEPQRQASHLLVYETIKEHYISDLDLETVQVLRRPDDATTGKVLDSAALVLQQLHDAFVKRFLSCADQKSAQRRALIEYDVNERLGELACISITRFGHQGYAWNQWCLTSPNRAFEQIALVLHGRTG